MEFFDTHSHYNDEKFNEDREEIIKKIYEAGVTKAVVVGDNIINSQKAIELAKKCDFLFCAVGIHPCEIGETKEAIDKQIREIETLATYKKNVAIGEIGLDYYWEKDEEKRKMQKYAFIEQVKLANKLNLPIIIHSRDAIMDTIEFLKGKTVSNKKGILHCCQLNKDLVKAGLEANFYISFAGSITFKNSKNAHQIINQVPEEKLLIETDAPYLSPEPNRGKRNDSRNLIHTAAKIAEIKGIPVEEIAKKTYENAKKIYNIL